MYELSLLCLALSFLAINGAHGYLVFYQRHDPKWSISDHAVLNRRTRLVYLIGHTVCGLAFFVYAFLFIAPQVPSLMTLVVATVLLEITQAVVPSKGKVLLSPHSLTALSMWLGFTLIALLCVIFLDLNTMSRTLGFILFGGVAGLFIYMVRNRQQIYRQQFLTILVFFACMFVMSI